jgi:hypothetical protein
MLILILTLLLEDPPLTILKMTFKGADRELAQGAIERHDLLHREIQPKVWLIAVNDGTPPEWATKLTAVLPRNAGRFEGSFASDEEVGKVRSGEIKLQR